MDFADQIKLLAKRVDSLKAQIQTEEATKTSFIMPFFRILGYDVFNPLEFLPEFTADVGIKKGEKVDYAIMDDGAPIILIEAKSCDESLEKHGGQLFRYFATTTAKFGILTNGIEYRFFTDLLQPNVMDDKPFFVFNLLKVRDQDIAEVKKFQKAIFDIDTVFSAAEDLKYTNEIKTLLRKQMEDPDEKFIRYVLNEVYDGIKTKPIIDKFAPVITKSLNQFVGDLVNDRLTAALAKATEEDVQPPEEAPEEKDKASRIETTSEELEGFALVKSILRDTLDADRLTYKDTVNYFGILYENKNTKWVCRLKVSKVNKFIVFPDGSPNGKKYPLETLNSIFDYADMLKESAKRFL